MHASGLLPNDTQCKRKMVAGLRNLRAHGSEYDPERTGVHRFRGPAARVLDDAVT
jgi:hypothetical protein